MEMTKEEIQEIHRRAKEHAEEAKRVGTNFVIPGDPWENQVV